MTNDPLDELLVIGISGSLRDISYTRMAVELALEGARTLGVTAKHIDLRNYQLGFAPATEPLPPDVQKLKDVVRRAKGVILGTPEYHGSFSGVLKNAIDLMGFEEFAGKMIGLVGVSGGVLGANNALNGLRVVGRQLRAWVIPQQVSIAQAWKLFNPDGRLTDKQIEERVLDVGRQVAKFAFLHSSAQAKEFLRLWEESTTNPGG